MDFRDQQTRFFNQQIVTNDVIDRRSLLNMDLNGISYVSISHKIT